MALLYPGPIVFLVIVILVLLLLLLFWLAKLVVDVDESGVHASFHFLWPTRHIRFEDITRATATRYNSLLDYGGWGVRLTPKGCIQHRRERRRPHRNGQGEADHDRLESRDGAQGGHRSGQCGPHLSMSVLLLATP